MAMMINKALRMKDGPFGQYLTELSKNLAEEIGHGFCDGLGEVLTSQRSNAEGRTIRNEGEESSS